MIEALAGRIALALVKASPEDRENVNVIAYELGYKIANWSIVLLTLLIGISTGKFLESVLSVVSFAALRYFTGGFHFNSLTTCTIVSTATLSIIPFIDMSRPFVLLCCIVNVLILHITAGRGSKYYIAIIMILSNLFIQSDIIAATHLLQMALVLLSGRRNAK